MGARDFGVGRSAGMNIARPPGPRASPQAMFRREALKRRAETVFVVCRTRKFVSESGERCCGG